MLGLPMRQALAGAPQVFEFAPRDLAVPYPWNMVGGGNRQRRRIHGAVGPERTNRQPYSEKLDEASAWSGLPTRTSTPDSYLTGPFWELTKTTNLSSEATSGVQTAIAVNELEHVELIALGGSSTSISVGLLNTGNSWGLNLESSLVIDGPGTLSSRNGALFAVTGLSTTQPTRLLITRRHTTSGNSVCYIYPGSHGSTTVGASVKVTRVHRGPTVNGTSLGPYIKTLASAVTTTDWPRTNKASVSEGTTANLDAQLYFTNAATSIVGFDNSLNVPAGNTIAGTAYAYKSCAFPDGTLVTVSLFVEMDDGGAPVPSTSGGPSYDFMLVADGFGIAAADCVVEHVAGRLYRVSGSKVASIAGGGNAFYGIVKYAAQSNRTGRVTGWHVRDSQGRIDAYIKSGSNGTSVVTPPFGEIVTVPVGQPRIDYDTSGLGRGFKAHGAARNSVYFSNAIAGWTQYTTGTATLRLTELWDPVEGPFVRITKTGGAPGDRAGAYIGVGDLHLKGDGSPATGGVSAGVRARVNSAGTLGYAPYMDATVSGGGIAATRRINGSEPAGVWFDAFASSGGADPLGGGTFHLWVDGAVGDSIDVCRPRANGGLDNLNEYVETIDGNSAASDAESLETFDLQALDLHNGRGTILVDFIMPEVTSGNSHGIMGCANANGFEWMGIYTSTTDVAVSCYSAGTRYQFAQGFSAGDRVRAALTFDTGYFASAVNGVPGPVTYGNNPIAYDRVITGDLVGPRSYPADTTISRAVTTGRVMFLDELVGKTAL